MNLDCPKCECNSYMEHYPVFDRITWSKKFTIKYFQCYGCWMFIKKTFRRRPDNSTYLPTLE